MERTATQGLSPVLRRLLFLDAIFEAVVGLALLGLVGSPHEWLDVSRAVALVASAVFFLAFAALVVAAIWTRTNGSFVRLLAFGNVAGGAVLWVFALASWESFQPEGRWLISATADMFILIGILEFIGLRGSPSDD